MANSAGKVPDKASFKIGEVCDITGVQAHVLRYWESEFPMLAPQKNRAGQRTYRKRDVEMVLRIKELLYEDQYTIAGAKRKLASEFREKEEAVPDSSQEPLRILIADADSKITTAVQEYMKRAGKEVFVAGNGREALDEIRNIKPDLIILETMLPVIDGQEVCRRIKADKMTRHIPVIFLSAHDDVVDKVIGLELGASDYIPKPFSLRELEARISAVLRDRPVKRPTARKEDAFVTKLPKTAKRDPYRIIGNVLSERYRLIEYAGSGGMGAVYRASDATNNKFVAVKILKPDVAAGNPEYVSLFEKEVNNAQKLRHPHIVQVLDSGHDDDIAFMVMEWIDGSSIECVVSRGRLSMKRIVNIFEQICSAVACAHESNIIRS